jgi:hypothetical protein
MPGRDEIVRSLTGAWRLFLDRSDALRFFDVSVDGFWRSFGAILLILPAYILVVLSDRARIVTDALFSEGFDATSFFANRGVWLALNWVALPILLAAVAHLLGVSRTYASYVVVRNWCAVLTVAPFGLIALLYLAGLLSNEIASVISLVIIVVVIRFDYLIARRALGADIGLAVAIVLADLAIGLAIAVVIDTILPYAPLLP